MGGIPNYQCDLEVSRKWIDAFTEFGFEVVPSKPSIHEGNDPCPWAIALYEFKISYQGHILYVALHCKKLNGILNHLVGVRMCVLDPLLAPIAEHLLVALSGCAQGGALYTDEFYVGSQDKRDTLKRFFEGSLMLRPRTSISSQESPPRFVADYYDDPSGVRFFLGDIDGVCCVAIKQTSCFLPWKKRKQKGLGDLVQQTLGRYGFVKKEFILKKPPDLKGKTLLKKRFISPGPDWDHNHCAYCLAKFGENEEPKTIQEGYATEDNKYWVCQQCFADFRYIYQWTTKDE